jgi:hypothetical protein
VTTLRSLITAGFHNKLILLRSYSEMAAGIEDLALPSLTVSDLFRPHKIVTLPGPPTHGHVAGNPHQSLSVDHQNESVAPTALPFASGLDLQYGVKAMSSPTPPLRRFSLRSSHSLMFQVADMSEDRCSTPELDSSDCSASSDISEPTPALNTRSPPHTPRMKHVNPRIVESASPSTRPT